MLNRDEIEQLIPHRHPFLWLDEVVSLDEKAIHARKRVDPGLEIFAGHYPHFPVLPGVILCEMAMQAAAVYIAKQDLIPDGAVPVATRLNNTQFRKLVRPGDTVDIEVELTERVRIAWFFKGKLSVGGQVAARVEFACASAPAPAE